MKVCNARIRKLEAPADRVPVLVSLTVDIDSRYCSGFPFELGQECNVDWKVKTLRTAACRKADALDCCSSIPKRRSQGHLSLSEFGDWLHPGNGSDEKLWALQGSDQLLRGTEKLCQPPQPQSTRSQTTTNCTTYNDGEAFLFPKQSPPRQPQRPAPRRELQPLRLCRIVGPSPPLILCLHQHRRDDDALCGLRHRRSGFTPTLPLPAIPAKAGTHLQTTTPGEDLGPPSSRG